MPAKPRTRKAAGKRDSGPAIAEAVAAGDFVAALDGALLLWRRTRQVAVADLIDAIAANCRPATIAAAGSRANDSAGFHGAWMRHAAKPEAVMVGALAAAVGKRLPVRDVGYLTPERDLKRNKAFLDRVEALSKLPHDPRVATALAEIVEKAPYSGSRRLYQPIMAVLVDLADERTVAVLERLIERPTAKGSSIRDYFADALPATVKAIAKARRTALSAADATALGGALERLGVTRKAALPHRAASGGAASGGNVQQLLAECLAKPDDDAPRAVLADALLEREDPRGELIALQLRPALGEAETKRVATLLRKHEKVWLGELHRVTKLRVWRRGFLDEAELQNHAVADDATWRRIANDPLLATVRVLRKGRANAEIYRAFALSPAMCALREVTVPTASTLDGLVAMRRSLDHVVFEAPWSRSMLASLTVLADHGLRRLTFKATSDPARTLRRLAGTTFAFHTLVPELTVVPGGNVYRLWGEQARTWLTAHAELAPVRRLGIVFGDARVSAEPGTKKPRFEIEVSNDYGIDWLLDQIGEFEHVAIRGRPVTRDLRPVVRKRLAAIPAAKLELRDGWSGVIGPSRPRRARRS